MFGEMPSYAFFIRHVRNIDVSNVQVSYMDEERRPPFRLEDVKGAVFRFITAQRAPDTATFNLKDVADLITQSVEGVSDTRRESVAEEKL
jgi:hypothetical protein